MTSGSRACRASDGVDGLRVPAVASLSVSILSLQLLFPGFMLLSLSKLVVDRSFWTKWSAGPDIDGVIAGVLEPESADGGLSVYIFSLSLSDSSPLMLILPTDVCRCLCLEAMVKDEPASGLLMRPSE